MRRILQFLVALALIVAPLGSGVVWADHHEKESSDKASDSEKAKSETPSSVESTATAATEKAMQAAPAGPVNINTASAEELQALPNIGPKKAQAILDYRKKNGMFKSVDDLKGVSGIGEKTLDGLKEFVEL